MAELVAALERAGRRVDAILLMCRPPQRDLDHAARAPLRLCRPHRGLRQPRLSAAGRRVGGVSRGAVPCHRHRREHARARRAGRPEVARDGGADLERLVRVDPRAHRRPAVGGQGQVAWRWFGTSSATGRKRLPLHGSGFAECSEITGSPSERCPLGPGNGEDVTPTSDVRLMDPGADLSPQRLSQSSLRVRGIPGSAPHLPIPPYPNRSSPVRSREVVQPRGESVRAGVSHDVVRGIAAGSMS